MQRGDTPLAPEERLRLLKAPRPRRALPLVSRQSEPEPLAEQARTVDHRCVPRHVVWELTLQCDLACRHCGSRAGAKRPDELSTSECTALLDQLVELGTQEVLYALAAPPGGFGKDAGSDAAAPAEDAGEPIDHGGIHVLYAAAPRPT